METSEPAPVPREPRGLLGSFDQLLTEPLALLERARPPLVPLLAGAIVGAGLYGAAAGFFQGGWQILLAGLKAPLILAMSLLLCLPSLYVLSSLAGARWTLRTFLATVAGFAATLALLLLALLPIGWLFSVSSRYLGSVVWLHLLLWALALILGWRFLGRALAAAGAHGGTVVWLFLFALVSLQVATFLRPILWRQPKAPLFHFGEKMSFPEHFDHVLDLPAVDAKPEKAKKEETKPAPKPAVKPAGVR